MSLSVNAAVKPKNPVKKTDKSSEKLPKWNLNDLYQGADDPQLQKDLAKFKKDAATFQKNYLGQLKNATGATVAKAIKQYEKLEDGLGKAASFAHLYYALNQNDPLRGRLMQQVHEAVTDAAQYLVFFTLELNDLNDGQFKKLTADQGVKYYLPWLEQVRQYRPHQLPRELEEKLHEKSVTGRAAWIRLYDEYLANLRFDFMGKPLPLSDLLNYMSDPDEKKRKAAAESLGKTLGANIGTFALITNMLAKDKAIEDGWRKYNSPMASRHLDNQVEAPVVAALQQAVQTAYPQLAHRYYKLKAKWLGSKKMLYWNRNAPLPEKKEADYSWAEATKLVLGAYRTFSPKLAEVAQPFFNSGWIDAPVTPGKASGAFAHPVVPSAHPYLLLNWHGKTRDVMTLAHELGHGVHQVLAAKQGALMCDTPLTLAETASVFGEMLTFQALLTQTTEPKQRKVLLAGKVEDMLNTVVRQIAFYEFEQRVHTARAVSELTPTQIGEIWLDVQQKSLGPALVFDKNYANCWAYISHFIHSPFYVYAYAFGDCLVNALYAVYQAQKTPEAKTKFANQYLELLAAGGSKRYDELLQPFGLNARDPQFWSQGLNMISSMIDELETL